MKIQLRELNKDNWLETAKLSVSEQQKDIFLFQIFIGWE